MGSGISGIHANGKQRPPTDDIQMDVLPINQQDRDLHDKHMCLAAQQQCSDNPRSSGNYHHHTDGRDQTDHKEIHLKAEQTEGAEQRNSCPTYTKPRQDQEVHLEEPVGVPTPSVCKVPPGKAVPVIAEKAVPGLFIFLTTEIVDDFREFFRILVPLSVKPNQEMPNVESWIQEENIDNRSKQREANYQLLVKWKSYRGGLDDTFCKDIKEALRKSGKNETLAKLEKKFSEYFPHDC